MGFQKWSSVFSFRVSTSATSLFVLVLLSFCQIWVGMNDTDGQDGYFSPKEEEERVRVRRKKERDDDDDDDDHGKGRKRGKEGYFVLLVVYVCWR